MKREDGRLEDGRLVFVDYQADSKDERRRTRMGIGPVGVHR